MSIRFRCPKCKHILSVEDHTAGRQVRCSECTSPLRVPTPKPKQSAPPEQPASDSDEFDPEDQFKPRTGGAEAEMDLTPMVDVTFLLLVFFIVTASFTVHRSLQVPPVEENAATMQQQPIDDFEDEAIIVRVDSDNSYWVESPTFDEEKQATSRQGMLALVRKAKTLGGSKPPKEMLVMASLEATHDRVIAALDAGSAVEMNPIRLATMEDEDF